MSKQEFLKELEKALCGLPQDDIQKSLDFYSEMIDERVEEGLSEEEAVLQIGSAQEIAKQILSDIPMTKLVKQKIKPKHRLSVLEIVLLAIGSPVWLSLIISAIAVVFSVYVSLWAIIISLYSVMVSLLACGAAGVVASVGYIFFGKHAQGLFLFGVGIAVTGLGILMFFVCDLSVKGIVWLGKKIWLLIKSCFVKGERK